MRMRGLHARARAGHMTTGMRGTPSDLLHTNSAAKGSGVHQSFLIQSVVSARHLGIVVSFCILYYL